MLNYDNDSTINGTGRHSSSACWHIAAVSATEDVQWAGMLLPRMLVGISNTLQIKCRGTVCFNKSHTQGLEFCELC